jgi:hypothetical protein
MKSDRDRLLDRANRRANVFSLIMGYKNVEHKVVSSR